MKMKIHAYYYGFKYFYMCVYICVINKQYKYIVCDFREKRKRPCQAKVFGSSCTTSGYIRIYR